MARTLPSSKRARVVLPPAPKPERRPRQRRSREAVTADLVSYKQALDLLDRIDRMPADEGVKRIGQADAQAALELVGRMKTRLVGPISTTDEEDDV